MKLIGMLDSPYVRRVAISLQLLGLRFEHHSLSVFRTFAEFQQINPVVKAPTFLCDDGEVLMDSTLILEYARRLRVRAPSCHRVGKNSSMTCGSPGWRWQLARRAFKSSTSADCARPRNCMSRGSIESRVSCSLRTAHSSRNSLANRSLSQVRPCARQVSPWPSPGTSRSKCFPRSYPRRTFSAWLPSRQQPRRSQSSWQRRTARARTDMTANPSIERISTGWALRLAVHASLRAQPAPAAHVKRYAPEYFGLNSTLALAT